MSTLLAALTRAQLGALVSTLGWHAPTRRHWALVVDADRTLARPDTGRLVGEAFGVNEPIRRVFESHGYSRAAFESVSAIWSAVRTPDYIDRIEEVAAGVSLYPGWSEVFTAARDQRPVLVVTSGIPQVWRRVLARHGFADIPVLGGCHVELDSYLLDAESKQHVVEVMQRDWQVIAAGDSMIDENMLRQANLGIIVPDHKGSQPLRQALANVSSIRVLSPTGDDDADAQSISSASLRQLLLS